MSGVKLRHLLQMCAVALVLAAPARADDSVTNPAPPCPAGTSCAQPAGTSTAVIDVDGENGTMVSEMVVIFGFLGIVWSVPYLVLRRRTRAK